MSDVQVVQRVLDFWDPLGASLYIGGSVGQIDEYDGYAFTIIEQLEANEPETIIRENLDRIRFENIGVSRKAKLKAENRYYAWVLKTVWENHRKSELNNLRVSEITNEKSRKDYLRIMPRLELFQQVIQSWDPWESSVAWQRGANTLNDYDDAALGLYEVISSNDGTMENICELLEAISYRENDKITFCIQNHKLKGEELENAFAIKVKQNSKKWEWLAEMFFSLKDLESRWRERVNKFPNSYRGLV